MNINQEEKPSQEPEIETAAATPPPDSASIDLGGNDRLLKFSVGKDEFAIPLMNVKEVIAETEIVMIPNAPDYFAGLINLRGQVISVINLAKLFHIDPIDTGERSIVICEHNQFLLGLWVDSANSVINITNRDFCQDLPEESHRFNQFILGVFRDESSITVLIDSKKLCLHIQGMREVA